MPARILIVEDYQDARDMWMVYLSALGFAVDTAGDGASAIEVATRTLPDVIVMDLALPEINGCEVARRLRALPATSHIPMIATTGSTSPADLVRARTAGFDAVLIKPCDPPGLVAEIERALGARSAH